ncbi:MAG: hypothetical protein LBJ01_01915 [Tannerella sp.]|nr:hypothetical protein [Tannerella sp.]
MNFYTLFHHTVELYICSSTVYCRAFQRKIDLSIAVFGRGDGMEICRKLYFSTDPT